MMPEHLLSAITWLAAGGALLTSAVSLAYMRFMRKQAARLRSLAADSLLLDEVIMELRDTWDHLPRFLPMPDRWSNLAQEIGKALPWLSAHARHKRLGLYHHRFTEADFQAAHVSARHSDLTRLVQAIDDPTLTDLWSRSRFIDLVVILRLALFKTWQPGFDLSAEYREHRPHTHDAASVRRPPSPEPGGARRDALDAAARGAPSNGGVAR